MSFNNRNQRLNGLNPLAYVGDNAYQPPEFVTDNRAPTVNDSKNFDLGTIWLDINGYPGTLPTAQDVWMLVALVGNNATWINFAGGISAVETLSGDSGINPVFVDANDNINVFGDNNVGLTVVGDGVNTLTVTTTTGTPFILTETGNSGGPVPPDASGNLNVLGSGVITVVGTPLSNTLTITPSGSIASSFPTDSGTATPSAGVLNIKAQNATLGSGSSVLFSAPGPSNTVQLDVTDANSNTIIGNNAGNLTLTATNSVGLGKTVLHALTSGANNTVVGSLSGILITTGASNTIVGEASGASLTTGGSNTIIGRASGTAYTSSESNNIIIGTMVGQISESGTMRMGTASTGEENIFIGNQAGSTTLTIGLAQTNICIGTGGGKALTTGAGNSSIGSLALAACTTGLGNMAVGNTALTALTTGTNNATVGWHSYDQLLTGSYNAGLGYQAGHDFTGAESDNVMINNDGVVGDANTLRIGMATGTGTQQLNKSFIHGIRGITTAVNDAVAVLIDSAGQLGTTSSSARYKDNIEDMGSYSDFLNRLRPVTFNYKNHSPEHKSVGLIAEEVAIQEPKLVVYDKDGLPDSVKYHDLPVLLLNEFKKHCKILDDRDRTIAELLDRIRILEEKVFYRS